MIEKSQNYSGLIEWTVISGLKLSIETNYRQCWLVNDNHFCEDIPIGQFSFMSGANVIKRSLSNFLSLKIFPLIKRFQYKSVCITLLA